MNIPEKILDYIGYNETSGELFYKAKKKYCNYNIGDVVGSKRNDGSLSFGFTINKKLKTYAVHRVAWFIYYKEQPPKYIDHINRDPSDNRVESLRSATHQQNKWNTNRLKSNTTGYIGVTRYTTKTGVKYRAGLTTPEGKRFWQCGFNSAKDASHYYNEYVKNTRDIFGVINE